ncbi:MAG: NAD(P)-dependent oxidoreductase [Chloroflexi bacterium]|nr:NAD(P)-dependent oxidoreductase [Chloroflexota bacterium]MBV9895981.1 NAD(P)-dependent oxidoreductase [Chloroflexota bacterium]
MKVGFIGLGTMGASMASNLQEAGYELVVNDIRRHVAEAHLAAGADWADSAAQVAEASDVIFSSLPTPPDVEAVANAMLPKLSPGKVYFDLSTNSPTLIRELHARFEKQGVHLLDAPVSGGPAGAKSGKLAIWVGGEREIFQTHKKLLDAIGDQVMYVGPIGSGSIAKLVHNCTGYMIQCALAEAFTMGVKAGVEPLALWQAVRQGAVGRQRTFDRLPDHFLSAHFDPPAFSLRLAHKDVSLATQVGREHHVPMRMAHLALEELTEALNRGWGERDSRVAMLLQEERSQLEIKVDEDRLREAM